MVTKGFIRGNIKKVRTSSGGESYKYPVEIYIFKTAGDKTASSQTLDSLICYASGQFQGYQTGDCVIVTFEDNDLNKPIILGKLYTPITEIKDKKLLNRYGNVEIEDSCVLPKDITIGDFNYQSLINMRESINYMNTLQATFGNSDLNNSVMIKALTNSLEALSKQLTELSSKIDVLNEKLDGLEFNKVSENYSFAKLNDDTK